MLYDRRRRHGRAFSIVFEISVSIETPFLTHLRDYNSILKRQHTGKSEKVSRPREGQRHSRRRWQRVWEWAALYFEVKEEVGERLRKRRLRDGERERVETREGMTKKPVTQSYLTCPPSLATAVFNSVTAPQQPLTLLIRRLITFTKTPLPFFRRFTSNITKG